MSWDDTIRKAKEQFVAFLKSHVRRGRDLHTGACRRERTPVHGKGAAPHAMGASHTTLACDCGSHLHNLHFPFLDVSILVWVANSFTPSPYILGGAELILISGPGMCLRLSQLECQDPIVIETESGMGACSEESQWDLISSLGWQYRKRCSLRWLQTGKMMWGCWDHTRKQEGLWLSTSEVSGSKVEPQMEKDQS